jgi:hypothetical protein
MATPLHERIPFTSASAWFNSFDELLKKEFAPSHRCLEYPVDLAGVDVSFLRGLKNCCLVIEHFPDSSRNLTFELSRRQTPADAQWRRSLGRDVIAVLSFSSARVTGRKPLAILID